jgi:hypothetical protein
MQNLRRDVIHAVREASKHRTPKEKKEKKDKSDKVAKSDKTPAGKKEKALSPVITGIRKFVAKQPQNHFGPLLQLLEKVNTVQDLGKLLLENESYWADQLRALAVLQRHMNAHGAVLLKGVDMSEYWKTFDLNEGEVKATRTWYPLFMKKNMGAGPPAASDDKESGEPGPQS